MTFQKALYFFQKKKYFLCLKILSFLYEKNPLKFEIYLLFFFCYLKLKKYPKAMHWIRLGFYQFPENVKIAQIYAYFCIVQKKDPQEALISLAKLTQEKKTPAFTDFLLSKYYLRLKDLERGYFFAQSAYHKKPDFFLFKNHFILVLTKLKAAEELEFFKNEPLAQRIMLKKELYPYVNLYPLEKIELLRKKRIVVLDKKIIHSPLYQYWFYKHYQKFLPYTKPMVKLQIYLEQGKKILKNKKKHNNKRLFDENKKKIIAFLIVITLLIYLFKEMW